MLILALGICATSTAFSWIDGTMLHPVPAARRTGELVTVLRGVWNTSPTPPFSYPDYRDLRAMNHTFSGILGYHHSWVTLTGRDTSQRIYAATTSANYFDVLGVRPHLGRFFRPDEEAQLGGVPYLVLSYSLWHTQYGADPAILGKTIDINQKPFTVIGVAPEGFIGCTTGIRTDAWMPLAANTDPGSNDWAILHRDNAWLNVMGRLRLDSNRQRATQDLEALMRRLVAEYPNDHPGVNTITLDPLWRSPFGANVYLASALPILMAIAAMVLLLTCANVATLALVRFVSRRREIAIRKSLGAGRFDLMWQMILEGSLVSLAGGGVAILLTLWTSRMLGRMIPPNANPIMLNGTMDGSVIGLILLMSLGAGVLCGALPARRSSHVSPAEVLKEETANVSTGAPNRRLLSGLVVAQIALSLALLVCAGLLLRTLRNMSEADPGFEQAQVLTASVGLGTAGYSADAIRMFQRKLLVKAEDVPGVSTASLTDWLPFDFNRKTVDAWPAGYVPQRHESEEVQRADVSPEYFATLGIPLIAGRSFTADDRENAQPVAIVDQTAANRYWPGQDAVGRRLQIWGRLFTVVGVARNSKHQGVNETPEPMVYLSFFQEQESETILQVRTTGDPQALMAALEGAIHQVNPALPVFDVRPLRETTHLSSVFAEMETKFASAFALLALVLATLGIYGAVAYRTQLRTHEIAIRIALGAARGDVLRLVVYQGLRLTAIGVGLGLALALALTRFLSTLLYGVSATDPLTIVSATGLLAAIAVTACYFPAAKAMRVDPVAAIRAR